MLPVIVFLVSLPYAVIKSKNKLKTVVWAFVSMIAVVFIAFLLSFVPNINNYWVGSAAFDLAMLTGALAALLYARKTQKDGE